MRGKKMPAHIHSHSQKHKTKFSRKTCCEKCTEYSIGWAFV